MIRDITFVRRIGCCWGGREREIRRPWERSKKKREVGFFFSIFGLFVEEMVRFGDVGDRRVCQKWRLEAIELPGKFSFWRHI